MSRDPKQQFIYSGQALIATITETPDGRWNLAVRRRHVGTFESREQAVQALNELEGDEL
jgi:subtilisin-like proprotein convertase family protein